MHWILFVARLVLPVPLQSLQHLEPPLRERQQGDRNEQDASPRQGPDGATTRSKAQNAYTGARSSSDSMTVAVMMTTSGKDFSMSKIRHQLLRGRGTGGMAFGRAHPLF